MFIWHGVEGDDLDRRDRVCRCQRPWVSRLESVQTQSVPNPRRDRSVDRDAARNRRVWQRPAFAGDPVEMRCRDLAVRGAMEADEHDRLAVGRGARGTNEISELKCDR